MTKDYPVSGLKEIDRILSAFPKNMQKNAIRGALRAAGNVVLAEARYNASAYVESGKMAKSLGLSSPKQNQDGTFSVKIRYRRPGEPGGNTHAFLGVMFEYGIKPHLIARTGSKEGRVAVRKAKEGTGTVTARPMKIGDDFVSGIIEHPGMPARPILRPALDVKAKQAVEAFRDQLEEYVFNMTGFQTPAAA